MKRKYVYVMSTHGGNAGEDEVDRLKAEGWQEVDRLHVGSRGGQGGGDWGSDRDKVILGKLTRKWVRVPGVLERTDTRHRSGKPLGVSTVPHLC